MQEIKHFKVAKLPASPKPNSVYYVKSNKDTEVQTYITDKSGFPFPLIDKINKDGLVSSLTGTGVTGTPVNPKVNISTFRSSQLGNLLEISLQDGKLFVKPIHSPDGSIDITNLPNQLGIEISSSLLATIQSALQAGDNTSSLINDGSDGTSAYVEIDELGKVAFTNDYYDLDNLPIVQNEITNTTDYNYAISGIRDAIRPTLYLSYNYAPGTLKVYVNGLRQTRGEQFDFVEGGSNILVMNYPLDNTDLIIADYTRIG